MDQCFFHGGSNYAEFISIPQIAENFFDVPLKVF